MKHKHLIVLATMLILLSMSTLSWAQGARDYAIESVTSELIDEDTIIRLSIVIENNGADGVRESTLIITRLGETREILLTDRLEILAAGERVTLPITFRVDRFEAGTQPTLEIRVGIDSYELENTPIARDNITNITLDIPTTPTETVQFGRTEDGVILFNQYYSLVTVAWTALAIVGVVLILWMLAGIWRLLFNRPPRLGAWQPPYGVMPMYDQNTIEGRRWGWQQTAQNSLLLAPPTDGNIHAIKMLTNMEGENLDNWKVIGMRLSQYDVYGRIARTQVLADKKWVRRMNAVIKKRADFDEAKLQKRLRPITDSMIKRFVRKVSKKTVFLPIAFDIRWEGNHGEVRITFELYQFANHAWYRIDQWDPMMQVVSRSMQENYTFTIHGKDNAEKMQAFRERLRDDLIWLLLETLRVEPIIEEKTGQQPAVKRQYDVPDTLAGMDPVQEQGNVPTPTHND
ncbi:MAG: hypothetical protein ACFE0Q_13560 [Anaerolineae bacterium]